jgi:PRC-barrel domain
MSRRILMATVAALALAAPAAAQDQPKPLDTKQEAIQPLEQTQEPLQNQSAPGGAPATQPGDQATEPTEAEQPPVTVEEAPAEAPAEQEVAEEEEATPPPDMTFIEVQDEAQFLADEEVIGKEVVNIMDEEVGTIADLVMDQDQNLVGVVLSVGGFLGIAEKWVAVPVEEIDFPTAEQPARLLVAVTEEQLKNAPDFTTRAAVEAEAEAERAQEGMQQQQQIPPPATTNQ